MSSRWTRPGQRTAESRAESAPVVAKVAVSFVFFSCGDCKSRKPAGAARNDSSRDSAALVWRCTVGANNRSSIRSIGVMIASCSLALLCFLWGGLAYIAQSERQMELESLAKETGNYAGTLAEHTARTIGGLDEIALYLKRQAEETGLAMDIPRFVQEQRFYGQPYLVLGVYDAAGKLVASSQPLTRGIDSSDREFFQVHRAADSGELFIGKPVLGRVSGKQTIHLSRRINKADGSFGGVAVISLDPQYFLEFYQLLDLGGKSSIAIIGRDGIVRLRQRGGEISFGDDYSRDERVRRWQAGGHGTFRGTSADDGLTRIVSYRMLQEYPLAVWAGLAEEEALGELNRRLRVYYGVCSVASVLILLVGGLLLNGFSRRIKMENSLADTAARMSALTRSIQDAVIMIDSQGCITFWNPAATRMFGYTAAEVMGRRVHEFMAPERYQEKHAKAFPQFQQSGTGPIIDGTTSMGAIHKDGHEIEVEMSTSAVFLQGTWHAIGVLRDITERQRAEAALQRSARMQSVLREITEAAATASTMSELFATLHRLMDRVLPPRLFHVNLLDEATGEIVVPFRADEVTEIPERRPVGKGMTEYIMGLGHAVHFTPAEVRRLAEAGEYALGVLLKSNRHYLGAPLIDSQGKPFGVISVISLTEDAAFYPDDTEALSIVASQVAMAIERKRLEAELTLQATTDELTGIANRRHFLASVASEVKRSERYGSGCALLLLDIDHFKRVNDTFGHGVGDSVLRQVATICAGTLRSTDLLGRIGGEEFAILLIESSERDSLQTAERLRQKIADAAVVLETGQRITVTVSIGVACPLAANDTVSELLQRADRLLYLAKANGRNRVEQG